ncbi:MAG: YbgC/FadM family acyl-CoA thioesterase [Rhizobiales bacterium]|nr:YbgC/FadM family acyl-CoA thioesterase [Hyphomicrobiales bacterium]NRB14161.1 YbgC/FadM family acyl-CoA thioesterase [Hyphomicrobiales bacterium]
MTEGLSGSFNGKIHSLSVRIYYEDTDFSGRVYHANYLKYCERGRTDYLRLLDIQHEQLASLDVPLFFVVRHMELEFLAPAKIDDILQIKTHLVALKGVRFILAQNVYCGSDLLFKAVVTCAIINGQGKPTRIDADTRAKFQTQLA